MPRSFVLGNGSLLIGLDRFGQVRDLYFPHIGLENQVGAGGVHKIGIWIDGQMSWLDSNEWNITIDCAPDALAAAIDASHKSKGISITFEDIVYNEKNIFIRKAVIKNLLQKQREIKIFFYQQFELYESHRGDTAYFDPIKKVIVHYKGRRVILLNARKGKESFDDYGVGLFHIEGREGSFRDAEDGELSKNAIEHGKVDSILGLSVSIAPQGSAIVHYWLTIAKSLAEAMDLNSYVLEKTPDYLMKTTKDFWRAWINKRSFTFMGLDSGVVKLFKKSLFIIRSHVDTNGAIIASGDSDMLQYGRDTYSYMWPRDGAISAMALDKAGDMNVARRFFEFCNTIVTDDGYFLHKFRSDGSLGSSWHPWVREGVAALPIQEDETALVLYALGEHYALSRDLEFIESVYNSLIKKTADFLASYRDKKTGLPLPSYDLWEEKYGVHTFTASAVYGALTAASRFAGLLGKTESKNLYKKAAEEIKAAIIKYLYNSEGKYFYKMLGVDNNGRPSYYDTTIDTSSIYGVVHFSVLQRTDMRVFDSFKTVNEKLCCHTEIGGIPRYEGDRYYRLDGKTANPWFITTLWLAEQQIAIAKNNEDLESAREYLRWVARYALPSGVLSEQINPFTGEQLSAAPLTWSHSEFVLAVICYLEKLEELGICDVCNPMKVTDNPY